MCPEAESKHREVGSLVTGDIGVWIMPSNNSSTTLDCDNEEALEHSSVGVKLE